MALPKILHFLVLLLLLSAAPALRADPVPEADAAWQAIHRANPLPILPPEWQKTPPEDSTLFRNTLRAETERLLALAEQAGKFAAQFPQDPRRYAAWQVAGQALASAQKMGSPTARTQLAALDRERLADPQLPIDQRLEIRTRQLQAESEALVATKPEEARDKYEQGARDLIAEFPGQSLPWAMLMEVIDQGNDPATRAKLNEIADGAAPAPIKDRAAAVLRRYDALGKPLELKFTALDGKPFDLANLRGKIVIVQFWATWCDTCLEAMETMGKASAALRELGVEIVGINLDTDKAKVEKAVKDKGAAWPQYFDPAGTNNRVVRECGVTALPAMWLVDREGILRDLNAQADMTKKIEAILSENPSTAPK